MSEGTPNNSIPNIVEPRRLAKLGVKLSGMVPVAKMVRLREAGITADHVVAEIEFKLDESRNKVVEGRISAEVTMQCQRCLGDLVESLQCEVALAIVWSEENAKALPAALEPWIVAEDEADLYAMIEDEILLNMPFVAYHQDACVDSSLLSTGEVQAEAGADKNNPFEVLKHLKETTKK